ncbi:Ger(x)C family spore germination protein [Oceanobacillus piezotolerans]|nr:Ger(x)C family spore germination protein [Oceanobacillus piezotolerans]
MSIKRISILFFSVIFLTGCVATNELEELAIISARGIDLKEDDEIETTLNIIRFDPEAQSIYTTIKAAGKSVKQAREHAGYQIGYEISEGQLRAEIYGRETATKGITPLLGGLIRDAQASDTMYLVIANSTASELMEHQTDNAKSIGRYLDALLTKEIKEKAIPASNIQKYTVSAGTIGQDPVLAIIDIKDDSPAIVGIGLLKGDRLVKEVSTHEGTLINIILDRLKNTEMSITVPLAPFESYIDKELMHEHYASTEEVTIQYLVNKGKGKIKVKNVKNLTFKTEIQLDIDVRGLSKPVSLKNKNAIKLLEKEMEKKLTDQYENLFKETQEANIDPFGFGKFYRANRQVAKLTDNEWRKLYPNISVDFHVDVDILQAGTIQ